MENKKKLKRKKYPTKTSNIVTEQTRVLILSLLIQGLSCRKVSKLMKKQHNISIGYQTVNKLHNENRTLINNKKKENKTDILNQTNEKYKEFVGLFLDVGKRALEHLTDEKLKASSGAALATISGISYDKHNIATGGVTERTAIKFENRKEMLKFLNNDGKNTKKEKSK